jgi:hypothetical protein
MKKVMSRTYKSPRHHAGFTILETLLAVAVSTLLFMLVVFIYSAYARVTQSETSQADIQEQLMVARRVIEKDVHMAGYNLPGNGFIALNPASPAPTPVFLSNDNNKTTQLAIDAKFGDTAIMVDSASGVSALQWFCLWHDTVVSYYHKISRIGLHTASGCDTVFLKSEFLFFSWDHSITKVSFAKAVSYELLMRKGSLHLVRHTSNGDQTIGESIDSISYVPKNASGALTWDKYAKVQTLQITLGRRSPGPSTDSRWIKTFDAMIRN